jgi:hypothetical protein
VCAIGQTGKGFHPGQAGRGHGGRDGGRLMGRDSSQCGGTTRVDHGKGNGPSGNEGSVEVGRDGERVGRAPVLLQSPCSAENSLRKLALPS